MQAEQKKPNIDTMGGCMLAGQIEIRKIKKKAILIVGDTRVGKSTLFNQLLKIPLIGVEIEDGVDVIYEHQFQQGVATKNTYKSVTLVPNVGQINIDGDNVSLIDLAGFSDEARSYVGIFGVSFMLEKILETVSEFKFVLAIAHPNFDMPKVEDFIKPFLSFIRMLHIEVLLDESHAEIAQKFFNSISVVIIKSSNKEKYYISRINKALQHLQTQNGIQNDRKIVSKILRSIVDNSRIQLFKKAEPDQRPTQNLILERLNTEKKWNYYKFEDNLPKQVLFLLPFAKQHEQMKDTDKNQYKNDFEVKSKKMKKSYQLLKKFFTRAIDNWYSTEAIDYSEQFQEISGIIENHPYGSFKGMLQQLKIDFFIGQDDENKVTRLDLLDKIKQIQKYSQEINDANQILEAYSKIHAMIKPCFEIFDIYRKTVCTNRAEQQKFIVFMFVNMRFLQESEMQNKLDRNLGSGIPFIVTQNISNILPTSCENLSAQFFLKFLKFKPSESEKEKFSEYLLELLKNIDSISEIETAKQLLLVSLNISVNAGKKFIKKSMFKQALEKLVDTHKDFEKFKQFLPQQSQMTQADRNLSEYKSLQIYDLIGICLENLNFHRQAVKIYTYTKSISKLMRCYEDKIEKQTKRKRKLELYEDYVELLQKNRKAEKLIQVLQKMIDYFRCFPEKRRQLATKLNTVRQNKQMKQIIEEAEPIDLTELVEQIESDLTYHVDEILDQEESEDQDEVFEHRNQDLQKSDEEEAEHD